MAVPEKKQIMDIRRPGKSPANATSRPIIVGHGAMIKDPMVHDKGTEIVSDVAPVETTHPEILAEPKPELVLTPEAASVSGAAIDTAAIDAKNNTSVAGESAVTTPELQTETSNTSDDSIIVDTVAGQATLSREEKQIKSDEAAHQEALKKLIDDKTYFLRVSQPRTVRSKSRIGIVLIVLALLIIGAYLLVDSGVIKTGIDLPFHVFKQATKSQANTTATESVQTTTDTITASTQQTSTTAEFKNEALGLRFTYPANWGTVTTDIRDSSVAGTSAVLTFSSQPLVRAGLLSSDYEEQGRDGVCYVTLGLFPGTKLKTITSKLSDIDADGGGSSTYKTKTTILKSTDNMLTYEHFEAGTTDGLGACLGVSVNGFRSFDTRAAYTGIQFFWGDSTKTALAVSEFSAYVANPDDFLSAADRQAFMDVVASVAEL